MLVALAAMSSATPAFTSTGSAIPVMLVSIGNQLYLVPLTQQQAVASTRPATASRQIRPKPTATVVGMQNIVTSDQTGCMNHK